MSPHDHAARAAGDWGARAAHYARTMELLEPELRLATEDMLDAVAAAPGTRLLDLACGPGHTTAAARARGAEALGIDVTPGMIDVARRRYPDARFALGDMRHPPPGPWDAITCRLGAHHADASWIQAAARVLAPGGRLAIAELDLRDERARENGMRPAAHWVRLFEEAGLEQVAVTTRLLRLGALAAREPRLADMLHAGNASHFQDGPAYVVSGRRP